jgi:DNA-binding CsgD family transcriptional regulator
MSARPLSLWQSEPDSPSPIPKDAPKRSRRRKVPEFDQDREIVLFDERSLVCDKRKVASVNGSHIFGELIAARTPEDRMIIIRSMLAVMGFSSFAYGMLQLVGERVTRQLFLTTYTPSAWINRYFRERYFEVDPRLRASRTSTFPLVWDMRYLSDLSLLDNRDPRAKRFLLDLDSHGLRSGIAFGLTIPSTLWHAVVYFDSANPRRDWVTESVVGQALTFGLSVHRFVSSCTQTITQRLGSEDLSEMQRGILVCLANGLSDKEIGARLETSPHNIDYHLRILRRKHGAVNRTQLAYVAGRLGLV